MIEFDIHDAAALLGYLTLLVGFAVLGSSALAFIQTLPHRLRLRNEPVKYRIQRVDPMHVHFDLGPDGTITDLVETDDEGHVVAEYHQPRPTPVPAPGDGQRLVDGKHMAAVQEHLDWLPEDDDDDRPVCD